MGEGDLSEIRGRNGALDGVRGLAVLAVILFHDGVSWAGGGFLGVDAFFVLSGFLITRLLLAELDRRGGVDLRGFYARRVRRLGPALLVVLAVVLVGVAGSAATSTVRGDALASLLFVQNWHAIVARTGYFAVTAAPSPLEHTWSLAVEEQFYVVWPALLMLVARGRHTARRVLVVAAGLAAASAVAMAVLHDRSGRDRAYLGTDARIHPILIGAALAALLAMPGVASRLRRGAAGVAVQLAAVAGAGMTALLWVRADGSSAWLYHGGFALAALATGAVVSAAALAPRSLLARGLAVAPLRALGRISYAAYLWHWPIQLAVTHEATGWSGPALIVLRFALTLAAAGASFAVVEEPVRRRLVAVAPGLLQIGIACTLFGAVTAVGMERPWDPAPAALVTTAAPTTTTTTTATPTSTVPAVTATTTDAVGAPAATSASSAEPPAATVPALRYSGQTVAFFGDSVAQSLGRGLAGPGAEVGLNVLDDAILGCGVTRAGAYRLAGEENGLADECASWPDTWSARVARDRPDVAMVLVGRHEVLDRRYHEAWTDILDPDYASYVAGELRTALSIAGSSGARVVVLTAPYYHRPEAPDGSEYPENDPARVDAFNALLRSVAAASPVPVTLVDLGARTGPDGHYTGTVDGVGLRSDGVHFSDAGCRWLVDWLFSAAVG